MPEATTSQDTEVVPPTISIPAGINPLFFSGPSQQIFECVVDTHLTSDNPHKLIQKKQILDDFKNRAAVCDFHPVKKQVFNYPGDELLIVYDHEFQYGENFYICITEAAKELVLNPPIVEGAEEAEGGTKEEEEDEDEIPCTLISKEWVCLGSDIEIKEGMLTNSRPLLQFNVSRKRRHFNSPHLFSDLLASDHPEACIEIPSQEDTNFALKRMEMDIAIQAVPEKTDSSSQTQWIEPCNATVQYSARELPEEEAKSILKEDRMTEFINKSYPRIELCLQQNEIMDMFVDDYKELSETDVITGNKSDTNLKEYQSFTDLKFSKDKNITCIDWHPTIKGIIAVSCGQSYSFSERIELSSRLLLSQSLVLIWSFTDPIHPQLFLEAPDEVVCFKFNPSNPNIIVGGCANGQIVLWNLEEYQDRLQLNKPSEVAETRGAAANLTVFDTDPKFDHAHMVQYCVTSAIKEGHSLPVCDIQWVPDHIDICSKTFQVLEGDGVACNQIISCSIDGTVRFWDTRPPVQKVFSQIGQQKYLATSEESLSYLNLTWKPFLKIPIPRSDFPGNFSATRVSIRERRNPKSKDTVSESIGEGDKPMPIAQGEGKPIEGSSTMFFVGSEDGEVVYCNWIPVKDSDSGKMVASLPVYYFNCHCGPVSCLERSPFFRDIVLSVGGTTWAIWKEGARSDALLKSYSSTVPLTGGAWSPTRPGVFFVTKSNGNVDVWDLMDRSHEPLLAQNISPMSITCVYPWQLTSKQLMLAVGDSGGTLHILEVPWSLGHPSSNETSVMNSFFEREAQRLESTTERMTVRENEKKAVESSKQEIKMEEPDLMEKVCLEEEAKKEYDDYLSLELKLLMELGVIQSGTTTNEN